MIPLLFPLIGDLIKRLFPDPQEQAQKLALLEQAQAQSDEAFSKFIVATQPAGAVVVGVPWVVNFLGALQNFIVALVRPTITAYSAYWIYPHLQSGQLNQVPAYAWIPILFWFTGRTVEKLLGGIQGNNGGTAVLPTPTPQPQAGGDR